MTSLDSNIFIYVLEKNPDFFEAASAALRSAASSKAIPLPTLTLTEILSGTADDQPVLDFFTSDSFALIELTKDISVLAGRLRYDNPRLKTPDAIHLATALRTGAQRFITNDDRLVGLKVGLEIVPLKKFA